MADNSLQGGTDSIRDIDRSGVGTGPKTQVFQLDHGGAGAVAESLTSATNPLPSYRPDLVASGTLAALNATIVMAINGISGMRIQITGTWVGTIQFEGTVDGATWVAVNAVQAGSTVIPQNTTTNGLFSPTPAGFASFRVNMTAFTSGAATVTMRGSNGTGGIYHNQYLPAFSVIPAFKIDQTTPGTTNLVAISGTVPVSGTFFQTTQPVSIATMPSTPVTGAFFQTTQPVSGTVTVGNASLAVTGAFFQTTQPVSLASTTLTGTSAVSLATLPALTAGSAAIGTVGVTSLPALATGANVIGGITAAQLPASLAAKTGALSISTVAATDDYARLPAVSTNLLLSAAATTNATSVKASAGALKSIQGYNAKTSAVYLKLYNKASAPTVGTDTPVKTIYLPAATAFALDFPAGYAFALGIAYAITGAAATADATALVAGDVVALNVDYI